MDRYNEWINSNFIDIEDKEILKNMSKEEIEDAFYGELSFGTAGIRGIMGLGTNRINKYTIGKVTAGLANYLNKKFENPSVVIAYDTRNNSRSFAKDTALILNYYGIKTYIFKEVTSTPELAFSIKYLNCCSGIVITSSHNAKIYNGYKVYNQLGSQIVAPEDELISKEINDITDLNCLKKAPLNSELFNIVQDDVHEAFIKENKKVIINHNLLDEYSNKVKITYSSLHGVGLKTATELFGELNINNYNIVKGQCTYDGNFTTAPEPNPEYINNFDLAIKYAKENNSDLILMTDPDADRLGVMYKNNNNEYSYINGNMLGIIFAKYLLSFKKIKDNSFIVRSIVTSNLIDKLAKDKNVMIKEVLTGCKNIAYIKQKLNKQGYNYLFGYEESLGYMFDINIDDKNGFSSLVAIIEILCYCKSKNINMEEYIDEIYSKYGYNINESLNYVISKPNYKEIINNFMNNLREDKVEIKGIKYDYLQEVGENRTNAIKYTIDDENYFIIRPSGTEPKIKAYFNINSNDFNECKNILENIKKYVYDLFDTNLDIK